MAYISEVFVGNGIEIRMTYILELESEPNFLGILKSESLANGIGCGKGIIDNGKPWNRNQNYLLLESV